jgi:hypothetical protein
MFQIRKNINPDSRNKAPATVPSAVFILILLLTGNCITRFDPQISKYDNVLVVDGLLTNLPRSCYVKLSHTYPYDGRDYNKETGADIRIIDDMGIETDLADAGNGLYLPADSNFTGIIGRQYKVRIETASGDLFESSYEELKEPVEIGDIYYRLFDDANGIAGVKIFLDTYDPLKKSFYYAWDYQEAWEYWVPYASLSEYLPELKICYKDVISRKILIESTKSYRDDKVIEYPVHKVDNTTNRLSIKYSILVRQYVLTEKTYEFFKNVKDINENTGTLFDRTPVIMVGNILNLLNPEKPVLGNFQVSGASEKALFISRDEIRDKMNIASGYEFCKGELFSLKNNSLQIDSLIRLGWVGMDTIPDPANSDTLIGLVISRACYDCTTNGRLKKPEFWNK